MTQEVTRRKEEFYCDTGGGGCGKYFITYLRSNMNGAYTIQCPNPLCNRSPTEKGGGHHHFRVIKDGLVTTDRGSDRTPKHIILGLFATLRDTPWHNSPEWRRDQMKAVRK